MNTPKLGSKFKLPGIPIKFGSGFGKDEAPPENRDFFQAFCGCGVTVDHTVPTMYFPVSGQGYYYDERTVQETMPEDGIIKNFAFKIVGANTLDVAGVVTIIINGAATSLTFTVPAGNTAQWLDEINEVEIKKNDKFYIKIAHVGASSGEWIGLSWSLQYQKT